ncbi:hypothetical protein D3C74_412970 [compost metagenome]
MNLLGIDLTNRSRVTCCYIILINQKDWVSVSTCFRAQHQYFLCLLSISFGSAFLNLRDAVDDCRSFFTHNCTCNHLTWRILAEVTSFCGVVNFLGTGTYSNNFGVGT